MVKKILTALALLAIIIISAYLIIKSGTKEVYKEESNQGIYIENNQERSTENNSEKSTEKNQEKLTESNSEKSTAKNQGISSESNSEKPTENNQEISAEKNQEKSEKISLPILMYHNISEKSHLWNRYTVSPDIIENDIKYLLEQGYTTIGCKELIAYGRGEGELPEKPIMLTVDDGFESFYAYMYPLLKKYSCKAVINPIGSCTDAYSSIEDHNLDYSYLTWEELKEMSDSGFVEIGNHTYDLHEDKGRIGCGRKSGESDEAYFKVLKEDIGKMQQEIKSYTAKDCDIFAYPYGKVSKGSKEVLEEMGFKLIFTCDGRVNKIDRQNVYVLGRANREINKSTYEIFKGFK